VLGELMVRAQAHPEERRAMGTRGREHALAHLGWDRPVALALKRMAALVARVPLREAAAQVQGTEAFLYTPDWTRAEWVEVVLSFMLAFKAGEPVVLVLPWSGTPGEPDLRSIQIRVLELAGGAGMTTFPDVALVDQPADLPELLAGYGQVSAVPTGRGAVAGLGGANGLRLAAARTRLCQG
jgi:hypothetical protein